MKATTHFPFEPSMAQIRLLFPKSSWKDCGKFWTNTAPQGSVEWLAARKGLIPLREIVGKEYKTKSTTTEGILICSRVTGSNFGSAAGISKFTTPGELALYVSGLQEQKFSEESLKNIDHGIAYEPIARR